MTEPPGASPATSGRDHQVNLRGRGGGRQPEERSIGVRRPEHLAVELCRDDRVLVGVRRVGLVGVDVDLGLGRIVTSEI